jgi:hypothetical protein
LIGTLYRHVEEHCSRISSTTGLVQRLAQHFGLKIVTRSGLYAVRVRRRDVQGTLGLKGIGLKILERRDPRTSRWTASVFYRTAHPGLVEFEIDRLLNQPHPGGPNLGVKIEWRGIRYAEVYACVSEHDALNRLVPTLSAWMPVYPAAPRPGIKTYLRRSIRVRIGPRAVRDAQLSVYRTEQSKTPGFVKVEVRLPTKGRRRLLSVAAHNRVARVLQIVLRRAAVVPVPKPSIWVGTVFRSGDRRGAVEKLVGRLLPSADGTIHVGALFHAMERTRPGLRLGNLVDTISNMARKGVVDVRRSRGRIVSVKRSRVLATRRWARRRRSSPLTR